MSLYIFNNVQVVGITGATQPRSDRLSRKALAKR